MIYEASKGETEQNAARSALMANCDKFIHNDRVFQVNAAYWQVASIAKLAVPSDRGGGGCAGSAPI